MQIHISNASCTTKLGRSADQVIIDRARVGFIVRSKFRKATRGRFLGYMWLVLDPLIISLIYLFVFSVVKSNPNASSILLGVTMYRVFQSSLIGGLRCIRELNGGFKAERVSTGVVLKAEVLHRLIDVFLQSILIATILVLAFDVTLIDGFVFLGLVQIMGFLMFGFGVALSPYTNLIPDLENLISYGLRLGFYASPAMYPMARMEGFHYRVNLYNPFAYFAEFGRHLADVDSTFLLLDIRVFTAFVSGLLLLAFFGLRRVDRLRWRMTTWS